MLRSSHIFGLAYFPSELWASVAMHLCGEDIGRLKMVGSKALWARITTSNVVKAINLGKGLLLFKSYPAFLNELPSIEELSLVNYYDLWWRNWQPTIAMMPKTLRKLQIFGPDENVDHFFRKQDGAQLILSDFVPVLESLIMRYPWDERMAGIEFPRTFLHLQSSRWSPSVALPESLTHLNVTHIKHGNNFILPPGLLKLEVLSHDMPSMIPLLPSSIVSVMCQIDFKDLIRPLPATITALGTLNFLNENDTRRRARTGSLQYLPTNLTWLSVTHMPVRDWPSLPQTLTFLELVHLIGIKPPSKKPLSTQQVVGTCPIHWLPQSLTSLKMTFSELSIIPSSSELAHSGRFFPHSLKHLILPNASLSVEAAMCLPSSLLELHVHHLDSSVCQYLSKGLRTLIVVKIALCPETIKLLPRSITFLQLGLDPIGDGTCIKTLNTHVSGTAEMKVELDGSLDEQLWQGDFCLPPGLRSLTLLGGTNHTNIRDSFAQQHFPNLETLMIFPCQFFTDIAIPSLSRGLGEICLSDASHLTGKCFADLPRYLWRLNLASAWCIDDSDVQHLPRTLEYLNLNAAVHLTNACIIHLPRNLRNLSLEENFRITQACFPDLPYHIRACSSGTSYLKTRNFLLIDGEFRNDTQVGNLDRFYHWLGTVAVKCYQELLKLPYRFWWNGTRS